MSDRELLDGFASGGRGREAAFAKIVSLHQAPLFRVIFRLTGHRQDAEDALQETFSQAYRGLAAFRGEAAISTWLFRIAVRVSTRLQGRRRPVTTAEEQELPHHAPPEQQLSSSEQTERLLAALARLPWAQRVTLSLSALEELDRSRIAEVMGVPVGTVDSRLHHARAKLREILGLEDADPKPSTSPG